MPQTRLLFFRNADGFAPAWEWLKSLRARNPKAYMAQSVISRLEDADYDGHSLAMLRRIASALEKRVEIRFVASHKLQHA